MKFQCLNPVCKSIFIYTAKSTEYLYSGDLGKDFVHPEDHVLLKMIERPICPFCHGLTFEEYVEPVVQEKIVSVKSVELDKVDEWIGQGYEVKELYAKTATMIKKEAKT